MEVISSYSRGEAISDGVLIDVSGTAVQCGFKVPVAITAAVFERLTPNETESAYQDFEGRLWDLLSMMWVRAKGYSDTSERMKFKVLIARSVYNGRARAEEFVSVIGPGDNMEPVITIMLPNES